MGFGVKGLGFRVEGLGFVVRGSGFGVWGFELTAWSRAPNCPPPAILKRGDGAGALDMSID